MNWAHPSSCSVGLVVAVSLPLVNLFSVNNNQEKIIEDSRIFFFFFFFGCLDSEKIKRKNGFNESSTC